MQSRLDTGLAIRDRPRDPRSLLERTSEHPYPAPLPKGEGDVNMPSAVPFPKGESNANHPLPNPLPEGEGDRGASVVTVVECQDKPTGENTGKPGQTEATDEKSKDENRAKPCQTLAVWKEQQSSEKVLQNVAKRCIPTPTRGRRATPPAGPRTARDLRRISRRRTRDER
jgi:hypothetical protein